MFHSWRRFSVAGYFSSSARWGEVIYIQRYVQQEADYIWAWDLNYAWNLRSWRSGKKSRRPFDLRKVTHDWMVPQGYCDSFPELAPWIVQCAHTCEVNEGYLSSMQCIPASAPLWFVPLPFSAPKKKPNLFLRKKESMEKIVDELYKWE